MKTLLAVVCLTLCLPALLGGAENRFVKLGVPTPDREWSGEDYIAFMDAVSRPNAPLPTYADADGTRILERFTQAANLFPYKNTKVPPLSRLTKFREMHRGMLGAFAVYARAVSRGEKLNRELATMTGMVLRISAVAVDISEELRALPRLDGYEKEEEARLKAMANGFVRVIQGVERSLALSGFYSDADRSLLLRVYAETLPRLRSQLTPEEAAELRGKLEPRTKEFSAETDRRNLATVLTLLSERATPQPGSSPSR